MRHSGMLDHLPASTKAAIRNAIRETRRNDRIILNFCLNYGGRQEIVNAVNRWSAKESRPAQ